MKMICTNCGYVGEPKPITKGSIGMEVLLWLLFLAPGFIYSIWRLASRYDGCPKCKHQNLIPIDSPNGKKIAEAAGISFSG